LDANTAYRHAQPFTLLWLLVPLLMLGTAWSVWLSGDSGRTTVLVVIGLAFAALLAGLGRLVVEVRRDELRWSFGFLGWPRWRVALRDIAHMERTHAAASRGAGIKGPRADRLYNATLGGPALRLTLHDGRVVTLGTPEPERLRAFIEARRPPAP